MKFWFNAYLHLYLNKCFVSNFRHCDTPKDIYSNGLSALTRRLGISPSLEKRIEKFYGVAFVITILFVILCFVGTMFKAC